MNPSDPRPALRPRRSLISRRAALALAFGLSVVGCGKHEPKKSAAPDSGAGGRQALRVGFAQIGAESDWRRANTQSIRDEAAARGVDLVFVDAQGSQANQIRAIRSFIAQGVDVIAFAPVVETGFEPVLREVKEAGIPVILTDREVEVSDPSLYATFIGADFVAEGRAAAEWLAGATSGQAGIAQLEGTPGAAPAIDRRAGFEEAIAAHPAMHIIKSQSGEFTRAKGREVMESFLNSPEGPRITAVYAHNDDMALGAIQAIEAAGKKPGVDILVVSIDGVKAAFQAMTEGSLNCTVECNPLLGPALFDAAEALAKGKTIERRIVTPARVFTGASAAAELPNRQY